jgi:hypothetical protein
MYKFIKLKNGKEWLLECNDYDTLRMHYKKYCAPVISEGTKWIVNRYVLKNTMRHSDNMFAKGFEGIYSIYSNTGMTVAQILANYEIQVESSRQSGGYPKYLYSDLRIYAANHVEYSEEYESESMKYPFEKELNINDVRYLQWAPDGHWYAKIGNIDIVDEFNNQKWNTKSEAVAAAEKYIKKI